MAMTKMAVRFLNARPQEERWKYASFEKMRDRALDVFFQMK